MPPTASSTIGSGAIVSCISISTSRPAGLCSVSPQVSYQPFRGLTEPHTRREEDHTPSVSFEETA